MVRTIDALAAARCRSEETLAEMQRLLHSCGRLPDILTIAVSGSLGRLEQTARSDADVIVVLRGDVECAADIVQTVWRLLEPLGMPRPKNSGIFSVATTRQQLCDTSTLGIIDEDMSVFGQRMQLLLDSRPVFNASEFLDLQRSILTRFTAFASTRFADLWRPLLDDLLRYHRSLCVRYQHAERRQLPNWPELRLKAGFSRLINIAGLLFLLAESTVQSDPRDFVSRYLSKTPLDRISFCYEKYRADSISKIVSPYCEFLTLLDNEAFHKLLKGIENGDPVADEDPRLVQLFVASDHVKSELLRFLLARVQSGDWPRRFLEHLIF